MIMFHILFLSFIINLMLWTEDKKLRIVISLWAAFVIIFYMLEV